ncbi:uncharacterized protein LOC133907143 [Phragmites australis]|uniref:uncharacterized protein LOC133907143 n=1 Tax=Phragmites australis TaxID=29695 RepID=UPI002D773E5E|nr:uncharacterized protein LOC133907143 [Phragmites australis]
MEQPTQEHMTAVKRILHYVARKIKYGDHYRKAKEGQLWVAALSSYEAEYVATTTTTTQGENGSCKAPRAEKRDHRVEPDRDTEVAARQLGACAGQFSDDGTESVAGLQHELACSRAALKVKTSELEDAKKVMQQRNARGGPTWWSR